MQIYLWLDRDAIPVRLEYDGTAAGAYFALLPVWESLLERSDEYAAEKADSLLRTLAQLERLPADEPVGVDFRADLYRPPC